MCGSPCNYYVWQSMQFPCVAVHEVPMCGSPCNSHVWQSMQFSLFRPHSFFFSLSTYFLVFRPALGMAVAVNRKRKQRSQIEAKNEILHELPYTEIVKSWTCRLASAIKLCNGPQLSKADQCKIMQVIVTKSAISYLHQIFSLFFSLKLKPLLNEDVMVCILYFTTFIAWKKIWEMHLKVVKIGKSFFLF